MREAQLLVRRWLRRDWRVRRIVVVAFLSVDFDISKIDKLGVLYNSVIMQVCILFTGNKEVKWR